VLLIERGEVHEPTSICREYREQILPVAQPLFHVGFKANPASEAENVRNQIMDEILVDIIGGEASPLYRRLYDEGLINAEFSGEAMSARDYSFTVFAGESRDPARVRDEIVAEITRLRAEGVDPAAFARCKKAAYGGYVGLFGRVESVASLMMSAHFAGMEIYRVLEMVAGLTLEDITRRLQHSFDVNRCALSVVKAG
jgi:predicted Zn-dependent peptidase